MIAGLECNHMVNVDARIWLQDAPHTSCSREGLVVLHGRSAFVAAVVSHDVRVAVHWLVERFSSKVLKLVGSGTEYPPKAAACLERAWRRREGNSNSFK
jgi:hypothetical protein